jgi:predicted nucleic acid-binding protein
MPSLSDFRTDGLVQARQAYLYDPNLQQLAPWPEQIAFVIDASCAIGDCLYAAQLRGPGARTRLMELLDAGVIVAYAPEIILDEVERHLYARADKQRLPFDRVVAQWQRWLAHLRIVPTGDLVPVDDEAADRLRRRDAEDLPYYRCLRTVGAQGVLTCDHDLYELEHAADPHELSPVMVAGARGRAVELRLKLSGATSIRLTVAMAVGLRQAARRIPGWLLGVGIALGIVAALAVALIPELRARVASKAKIVGSAILDRLGDLFEQARDGAVRASAAEDQLRALLPPPATRTDADVVYGACLRAGGATIEEVAADLALERRIPMDHARALVAEALQSDGRLRLRGDRWAPCLEVIR